MCPDKKLTWFDDEKVATVEQHVRERWSDTYERFSDVEAPLQPEGSPIKVFIYLS